MLKNPPAGLVRPPESFFRRKSRQIAFYLSTSFRLHLTHFSFCVLIILVHMVLMTTPLMQRFEYVFLDLFFRQRTPINTHSVITYIDMAEDSLQMIGRWPWPRHNHAALVHILHEWGAKAIVFDVIFSEPSTTFEDESLIEAVREAGNVYLPVILEDAGGQKNWIHSIPEIEKNVKGFGHVNIFPDRDGTLRRVTPFLTSGGEKVPSLALQVAYDFLDKKMPSEDKLPFPVDDEGNLFINWAGKWHETFRHFSFVDVIKSYAAIREGKEPDISPKQIRNKICIVGLTAAGLTDIKANPMEETYPAVGVQANIMNSILTQRFIYPLPLIWNRILLLIIGTFVSLFFIFSRKVLSFIVGLTFGLLWAFLAFVLFSDKGIWVFVMNPILLIFSLFISSAVFSITVGKEEQDRLFTLATRDGLTGLFVIRHFRAMLNEEVLKAHRKQAPLSLILLDIDHFKSINDVHGHVAGDAALKFMAAKLQSAIAVEGDLEERNVAARYGGEEFIVMLKNCYLTDASFNYAEKIRRMIEESNFEYEGKRLPLTVSLGVSTLHSEENVPDLMVHRADEALYRAKSEGRNRTCIERENVEE